jgi:hypothetical protein
MVKSKIGSVMRSVREVMLAGKRMKMLQAKPKAVATTLAELATASDGAGSRQKLSGE